LLLRQNQELSTQNKKLSTQIQQQFSHISTLEQERNKLQEELLILEQKHQLTKDELDCLRHQIFGRKSERFIGIDKNKKGDTHKGYYWVYHSPITKAVCFQYRKGRGREGPKEFLKDFQGAIQADGWHVYDKFEKRDGITLLGCLAHVRRKFAEAQDNDKARAAHVLSEIQKLYATERKARNEGLDYHGREELRNKASKPVLKGLKAWLLENAPESNSKVVPKSKIGKAISYALGMWGRIERYLEDGKYQIDNNWVENSIRPVALGRKNYLFAGSHDAAQRAAMIYSLLATCKKNDVEPYAWLTDVLAKIQDQPINKIEGLLPEKWQK
jgi:transposase